MTITFSQTGRDVVTGAMRDMGLIGLGESPEAEELTYGLEQLDLMLKSLAAEGWTPWTDIEATATITANVASVTLDPRPVEVSEVRVQDSTTYDRPLQRWNAGEYDRLPNRSQSGTPVAYELTHTPTATSLRVWPVPTTNTTVKYSYSRVIEDVDENTALDIPQMWGEAIRALLKTKLTAFGPIDPNLIAMAETYKRRMLDFDRPESYQLGPVV